MLPLQNCKYDMMTPTTATRQEEISHWTASFLYPPPLEGRDTIHPVCRLSMMAVPGY